MRVERHIFGSIDGYRTLAASPGLSAAECTALEGFAFGTPYDPATRATFAKQPAYWSRPLGAARRAITLVRPGEPDDAGRPTLLFLTAVISNDDWHDVLQGDTSPLLAQPNLWLWTRGGEVAPIDLGIDGPPPIAIAGPRLQAALGIVSLIEFAWGTGRPVVLSEHHCDLSQIITAERLLPPDIRQSAAFVYRSLNADIPATLNCLAASVAASALARPPGGAASPYARRLVQAGLLDGREPREVIRTYNRFAQTVVEGLDAAGEEEDMSATRTAGRGGPSRAGPLTMAAVALLAFAAGGATGWTLRRPPPEKPNPWPEIARLALEAPSTPGANQFAQLKSLAGRADDDPEFSAVLAKRIDAAESAVRAEELIAAANTNQPETIARANEAVESLRKLDPPLAERAGEDLRRRTALQECVRDWLGMTAQSLVPGASPNGTEPTNEQLEEADCLRRALEALAGRDARLNTPGVNQTMQLLRQLPAPRKPAPVTAVPVARHKAEDAISNLRTAFRALSDAIPPANARPRPVRVALRGVIQGLRDAAGKCPKAAAEDSVHFDAVFRRVADELEQVDKAIAAAAKKSPEELAADAELNKSVTECRSALRDLRERILKSDMSNTELLTPIERAIESLRDFSERMRRRDGNPSP